MQYDENAEKYGYEGEMTPMKCDELKAYKGDVTIPVYGTIADAQVYLKEDVDAAIAELKKKLMPCLNGDCILTCEVVEKYGKENAELKKKLEDAKASHYAEMVDAGMENRRLKRALWLARANSADGQFIYWCARFGVESGFTKADIRGYSVNTKRRLRMIREWIEVWKNVRSKCRAKAEEYR